MYCLMVAPAISAAKLSKGKLEGSLKGDVYTSPQSRFHIEVPVADAPGGRVDDGADWVAFTDQMGSLYRVDFLTVPEAGMERCKQMGIEGFLRFFINELYLPNYVYRVLPDSKVEAQRYERRSIFRRTRYVGLDAQRIAIRGGERSKAKS